ncbi:aromatic acid exporter family protein [Neobacillus sp. D3-1R]|uniref:aromatic acid exporter family protein n=1 Tax=Neobacillus sp. D3-1R TaxID=3445778 RepID=UPI003F9F250B
MKLGARIFKTGIAIILSLLVAQQLNSPSPVFAGIAAIFAVQPSIYRSYLSIIEQIQGNIIGAIMAVLFVLLLGNHVVIIGLAAIIVITINLKLRLENTIALSLVTLIAIMETPGEEFINFAFIRFSTIMIGVFSAFIVNLVFLPPKYENRLYLKISSTTEEILKWIRMSSRHASENHLLKNDIEKIKDTLVRLDQLYLFYKEERNYLKKQNLVKSRKLVIYRQMITTTKRALETLKQLNRYENELLQLSEDFQLQLQEQLDCLIHHHEQLLLRFIGKTKIQTGSTEYGGNVCLNKKGLFQLFIVQERSEENEAVLFHTMQVIAAIMDYGEHVEHLETLINSFQSYHKDDNEVNIEESKPEL